MENIINKGTNAGGINTNKNGLCYEEITDLSDNFTVLEDHDFSKKIKFNQYEKNFIATKQSGLFKSMKQYINKTIEKAHGCKNPDECYINKTNKYMFIIEKKFQQKPGSVCEKIQSADCKVWQYNRTFPEYKIVYIYCLSEWFKNNCKAELEYLAYKKIPVFWGNDINYKKKIIDFMINYS